MKVSKDEAKKPDAFLVQGQQALHWTEKHGKTVVAFVVAVIVLGAALVAYNLWHDKQEHTAQNAYYTAEKNYIAKKEELSKLTNGKLNSETFEQDFATAIEQLNKVILDYPTSKASLMAALMLSNIYSEHNKLDQAVLVIEKAGQGKSKGLLGALIMTEWGRLLADQGSCPQAIEKWQSVLQNKDIEYIHDEVRLKMGLCYDAMNDYAQAIQTLEAVSSRKDTAQARSAEKYLRLIKLKQVGG